MTTAYITHPLYEEHNLAEHPEHAGRIRAVWQRMEETGLIAQVKALEAVEATREQLLAVHTPDYLRVLEMTSGFERTVRLDADTYITPRSYEIARLSAGASILAVDQIFSRQATNALAACRPPGHHAVAERGMGFCLLSNVAIAARHAQQAYGLERVMIVDFDVHHGNGTEAIFYEDPSVLFISTHQSPLYPGTGMINDIGAGKGRGTTINVPVPPGTGDASFRAIYEEILWPAAQRYQPQLIIVSAGFDAHWLDPLAGLKLTLSGFYHISRELVQMAESFCEGRIVFSMEGGYNLDALSYGMCNVIRALLHQEAHDLLGSANRPEPNIHPVITAVKAAHQL